ncbi:hypothetical protein TTHERM_00494370 (macronuclear) [Tetrahymena thermophila SB210]|uniref:Uncharacterized protein n=1 Tax=Tetrahymena thermophila (strain SB210) TaxID=312017 RepID=I7M9X2_TETTS|nr:hypothetical protein TTHERM_00494370 [Tetrahymena thermophila SB210]EAS02982.1 hypothetical protein TTHERM_00494370 [Tetrahymena thermophila SB210]|eukprot:XP_001023227.1 hypothetical protein TTHERM_00494370 [Tetrahymena thermophila SB210]
MNNIQKLAEIPFNKLPKTLMKRILFPNIGKIEVTHKNQSKLYITTMAFVNNYAPSIKFYNDHLEFQRKIVADQQTPLVAIYDKDQKLIEKIDTGAIAHHTDILQRILKVNNQINPSNPGLVIDLKSVEGAQLVKEEENLKNQQ